MNMDSWTVNERLGLVFALLLLVVAIPVSVSVLFTTHEQQRVVCDAEGHIVQPGGIDAAIANAQLDDLRLQYRLGRKPWVRASALDKAEGCP